jgi:hypothetical protein
VAALTSDPARPAVAWLIWIFFGRAVAVAHPVITLLGEGTFHQVHGGAATGLSKPEMDPEMDEKFQQWCTESKALGQAIKPDHEFILAGHMPPECASWLARHTQSALFRGNRNSCVGRTITASGNI